MSKNEILSQPALSSSNGSKNYSAPIKGEQAEKLAVAILKQILEDCDEVFNTGDLQLFYERMMANSDDISRFIYGHESRPLRSAKDGSNE